MALSYDEFEKEKMFLENVKGVVGTKIESLKRENEELNKSITREQKEMWSDIGGMDRSEIEFANTERERSLLQARYFYQKLMNFEKVYKKPYFGRIDFKTDGVDKIYIGLSSVCDSDFNNYVYDWRAPISSLYYDYELGDASYRVLDDVISGEIKLKRQYKIEDAELLYAFDSAVNVQDEMLQDALSDNSSDKMKDIVMTIQREQNEVIRNTDTDNLIVQGAAGSGKTSVALHRIAFLLYRYRNIVYNRNIVIFSPSEMFSDYISLVLPSLGESNVPTLLFNDFLRKNLDDDFDIESYSQLVLRFHNTDDLLLKRVMEIKMDNDFIGIVDRYIDRVVNKIKFNDIVVDGEVLLSKDECLIDFNETYKRYMPLMRVHKIIENVSSNYKNTHLKRKSRYNFIIKNCIVFEDDISKIMKQMYYDECFLDDVSVNYHIDKFDFQRCCLGEFNLQFFRYYDAIIYFYLKAKLMGVDGDFDIKYVVVDEAQDYNLMQYYLLRQYYCRAKFTVLGDVNQAITSMVNYDNMDGIKDIIGGNSLLFSLFTTYRSSYEITRYCNSILNLNYVNMIDRHGEDVLVLDTSFENLSSFLKEVLNKKFENVKSTAILCENENEQAVLEEMVSLFDDVCVLPVYSAKGLEFDRVIVVDNGFSKTDKRLYYVACTRALHVLNILRVCN